MMSIYGYGSGYMLKKDKFKVKERVKKANIPRTIRFTEPLFEQLKNFSNKTNISFNSLVLQCCKYAMDHYEDESSNNKKWYNKFENKKASPVQGEVPRVHRGGGVVKKQSPTRYAGAPFTQGGLLFWCYVDSSPYTGEPSPEF